MSNAFLKAFSMTKTYYCIDSEEVREELYSNVTNEFTCFLMEGYIESVDWSKIPSRNIISDTQYKQTCEDFKSAITADILNEYKENPYSKYHILNSRYLSNYNYFNKPDDWKSHNPINTPLLNSFTMGYIANPAYQNNRLSIEIIKAYVAAAVFDEYHLMYSEPELLSHKIAFELSKNNLSKYFAINFLLIKTKWFCKWLLAPFIAASLFFTDHKAYAIIVAVAFGIFTLSKITNLMESSALKNRSITKMHNAIDNIEDSKYLSLVLSQDVIHFKSLRKLIENKTYGGHAKPGVFNSPLYILLDSLEKKGSYIIND